MSVSLAALSLTPCKQLRDLWFAEIAKSETGETRLDALSWLSKATLDIIGLAGAFDLSYRLTSCFSHLNSSSAGFNYDFDALNPQSEQNELNKAFSVIFNTTTTPRVLALLQGFFPPARLIVCLSSVVS